MSFILRATISFVIENALVHGVGFRSDVRVTEDNTIEFLDNGSVGFPLLTMHELCCVIFSTLVKL